MFGLFNKKYKSLSMSQAKSELDNDKKIKLIDVRTADEFRAGHIPKSMTIPLDMISSVQSRLPDKNTRIFTYCLSGARSRRACKMLGKMGYTDVTNIGAINAWKYEIIKGHSK